MQESGVANRILIAGTRETSNKYVEELKKAGFKACSYGVLNIKPMINEDVLKEVEEVDFDFIVFTSRNAVRLLMAYAPQSLKVKILRCRVCAIGEGTKCELRLHGFNDVNVPERESSMGLLEMLRGENLNGRIVGIFHSMRVNEELIRGLRELGALVYGFPLYDIVVDEGETRRLLEDVKRDGSALIVFLAKTAFQALMDVDKQVISILKNRLVIALGEMVSKALRSYDVPHYVLQKPNVSFLVTMIRSLLSNIEPVRDRLDA
ncbi:MAG: uroporphyrinogen-III synthase [Candidatus Nezhaarchaeota archaeon]|nr:uroporphyrinogen-III synthase [Candidatus Nezhaarchaeota archaeon]